MRDTEGTAFCWVDTMSPAVLDSLLVHCSLCCKWQGPTCSSSLCALPVRSAAQIATPLFACPPCQTSHCPHSLGAQKRYSAASPAFMYKFDKVSGLGNQEADY